MNIFDQMGFLNKECDCGKTHGISLEKLVVGSGVINDLPKLVKERGCKKPFVFFDSNTKKVGENICALFYGAEIPFSKYTFSSLSLEPNEEAVGSVIMHFDNTCDLVIAVGSGVINDIGKILAKTAKLPYFIVATAPSMDGYASATSSMMMDGLKVSLPSKCAEVVIGDLDVLKDAPMQMLQAGLGDMLAKYVSIAEWRISHEITGEYYCERIAQIVRTALKRCVDNADGLLKRDKTAVEAVFEGLVLCGIAMEMAGVSRPASGVEHYFSHVWDMRGLEFGTKVQLHGIQCAVATNIVAGLYEKVLKISPNRQVALSYVKAFDYSAWADQLKCFLGKGADAMIALEQKEQKYCPQKHLKRFDVILQKWDKICDIIREEIPTQKQISKILESIGAPQTADDIEITCDLLTTLKATKDIRDKYVLSRLLWDLGIIDTIME